MKKVLYLLTAAATLLFAASCARETVNPDPAFGGQTVTATVSVDLGQGLTKAYADGTTATKLLVFVYDAEKNLVASQSKTTVANAITVENMQATVNLRLVKGQKYSIAFWAQAADAPYTVSTTDNKTLTVTATGEANAENRDAFYGLVPEFTANEDIQVEKQITRPFAQLNVLLALQLTENATSSMTVTGAPNTLNLATGETSGSANYVLSTAAMTEMTFNKEYETGKNYGYAGVNYILAPAGSNGGTYDIQMEVTCTSDDLGTITLQKSVPTVPLKQNYRTNITWDPAVNADYTVIIAPGTGGTDIDVPVGDIEDNSFDVHIGGSTDPAASGVSVPVAVGENFSLTIIDSNGHAPDAAVSENEDVATVTPGNAAGEYQVNGIANGTTNVNFHIDSYTKVDVEAADFTVQVVVGTGTEEGVQSIAFSAETAEATIGAAFEAPTLDVTNAKGEVTYASGTPATATVDETTGEVTLVAAGTTVITATAAEATVEGIHYPEATASYTLTVNEGGVVIEEGEQSIAFSAETAEATIGAAFTAPTLDVSNAKGDVTYASGTPATATVDETTGEVTLVAAGETVITATAAEVTIDNVHYPAVTASYTLTVSSGGVEPPSGEGSGTIDDPYTVAGVRAFIDELGGQASTDVVYVKGIVCKDSYAFAATKTASFYISDDGQQSSDQFEAYKVNFLGNNAFLEGQRVMAVGDEVVVAGKVTLYTSQSGSTYETTGDSDSFVYKINGNTESVAPVTFTPVAGEVESGTTVTLACATNGATIHYTTDGSDPTTASPVYSSAISITAVTTVKAIAVKSGLLETGIAVSAYTIAVAGSTTVTTNIGTYASAHSWANSVQYSSITMDANITAAAAGGGNTGKYYTSGNQWRLYQNESATLTITAGTGHSLVSVKVTYDSQNTGILKNGTASVASGAVVSASGSSITLSVGNSGSATNGQVRVTEIEVVYE